MIKADLSDKKAVINILARFFENNKSVTEIVKQDHKKGERIRVLMEYAFEKCYKFGEVWLLNNRKGCALVLYPHMEMIFIKSLWMDIKLIYMAVGIRNIKKAIKRNKAIKKRRQYVDMAYLWFIGVDPLVRHIGLGNSLMEHVIQYSNDKILPIYLETSVDKNVSWYEKYGFQVYDKLNFGYTLNFLKRERDL